MSKEQQELTDVFLRADGKVTIDSAKLTEQVFARKRQRNAATVRLLAGSCGAGIFAVLISLTNWNSKPTTEVSQASIVEIQEQKQVPVEIRAESEEIENDWDAELAEQRLIELKSELRSLHAEQNAQQLVFLKEKISRTNWMESSTEFTGLTEF